jgi:hypothetical protein
MSRSLKEHLSLAPQLSAIHQIQGQEGRPASSLTVVTGTGTWLTVPQFLKNTEPASQSLDPSLELLLPETRKSVMSKGIPQACNQGNQRLVKKINKDSPQSTFPALLGSLIALGSWQVGDTYNVFSFVNDKNLLIFLRSE